MTTIAQTYNWEEQVITEHSENLQTMGIADDGSATIVGYGNTFYRSKDDGASWTESPIIADADDFDYGCISFYDSLGFAGASSYFKVVDRPYNGSPDIYANCALLKTTDGGDNWSLITVDSIGANEDDSLNLAAPGNYGVAFDAIKTLNDTVVYLSAKWYDVDGGKHSNIFKSTNAGVNWYSLIPDNEMKSISSITAFNGYVYIAGYQTLYKININDDSVTDLYPIVDEDEDDKMFFVRTTIYADNELIFPTYSDSIWITSDEGATFTKLPGDLKGGYYVYKYDENHIVVAGGSTTSYATSDGGTTWTSIYPGNSLWNCMVYGDSLLGESTGMIYTMAISDIAAGNFNWYSKDLEETENYIKGIDTTLNSLFLAGYGDYIAKSTDGGATFNKVSLPSKSDMIYASVDLQFSGYGQGSDSNAIASTRRYLLADYPSSDDRTDYYMPGVLLSTTDNWETATVIDDSEIGDSYGDDVSLNPYADGCCCQDYFAAECVNDTVMYVFVAWYDTTGVDYSSKTKYARVFKTSDAGVSWDTVTADLGSIYIKTINFEGDTGYITGNKTLLKTTDAGATVVSLLDKLTDLGATSPYVQNATFSGDTLYVTTSSDSLFVSYDGGESFSVLSEVSGANDFVAVDYNSFMTLGSTTKCFYTNDAGTNWDDCTPGITVLRSGGILADNIIALCKSSIYKLPVSGLDATANNEIKEETNNITSIDENNITLLQKSSLITIESDASVNECIMYSISGRKVLDITPNSTSFSFNTTEYENGIYIIKVAAGSNIGTYKIYLVQ